MPKSYCHLTYEERCQIEALKKCGLSVVLTLVGTCGAKMKVQPFVNVHYLFWERAKSRQFCGGISLQIGCVTGLQALPIGPDMDVYMAGDCCGLI